MRIFSNYPSTPSLILSLCLLVITGMALNCVVSPQPDPPTHGPSGDGVSGENPTPSADDQSMLLESPDIATQDVDPQGQGSNGDDVVYINVRLDGALEDIDASQDCALVRIKAEPVIETQDESGDGQSEPDDQQEGDQEQAEPPSTVELETAIDEMLMYSAEFEIKADYEYQVTLQAVCGDKLSQPLVITVNEL